MYLRLDYTYEIIPGDPKKAAMRKMLGKGAAEILCDMRDVLINEAVERWQLYKELAKKEGLTNAT